MLPKCTVNSYRIHIFTMIKYSSLNYSRGLEGYILLVSHLNAHTKNGIDWLNAVVVPGLRDGGGRSSTWEIEIHGSDGTVQNDDEEADDEQIDPEDADESARVAGKVESQEFASKANDEVKECDSSASAGKGEVCEDNGVKPASVGPPSGSPGPAVYVIHNLSKPTTQLLLREDDDPPMVPLKFFSY